MRNDAIKAMLGGVVLGLAPAAAEIIDGVNWADQVSDCTANIQNYGGVLVGPDTEWWLTGPPDADVNGNGYAWDAIDQDTVAGWRASNPAECVTMYWEGGLPDLAGDDLLVHFYAGPYAQADVLASVDGATFRLVGTIGGGTPGYLREETFDFDGLFDECVHYVKVLRLATGPQTGVFFDAFGGGVLPGDFNGDCDVDLHDLAAFQTCFTGEGGGPVGSFCTPGYLDTDEDIDLDDWALVAGEMTGPAS